MKSSVLALILITAPARAWDPGGHMLVGQIAWELSSAETRRAVGEMLATLDNRFNAGNPYNFTTASCWMDDLRSLPRKEYPWSAWHYVDGEKTDDGSHFKLPAPPNVVWAIGENLKTLRGSQVPAEERAKALGMLFHWVGDVHQPMHATTWNDRGGNGYLISGVPFSDLMPGMVANLHTYWDKAFRFDARDGQVVELWACPKVADRPTPPGEGNIRDEARRLMERFPREKLTELSKPGSSPGGTGDAPVASGDPPEASVAKRSPVWHADPEAWARESHILGCTRAYPSGPHPGNTEVIKLQPEFVHSAYEIACRRVVIAGHRLAQLLGEIFDGKK